MMSNLSNIPYEIQEEAEIRPELLEIEELEENKFLKNQKGGQ